MKPEDSINKFMNVTVKIVKTEYLFLSILIIPFSSVLLISIEAQQ